VLYVESPRIMTNPHSPAQPPAEGGPSAAEATGCYFADADAADLLGGHVEELSNPSPDTWELVKQNSSRTVYRGQIDGWQIYVKHFHSRTLPHRIGRWLGQSDARDEVRFSEHLASHGVIVPRPLAAKYSNGVQWVATLAVAPAEPADTWHERQLTQGPAGERRIRQATLALAELIGRMHAAGVAHGDLHCGNVLVRTDTDPPELVLTDLHRTHRRRRLSRRLRAANLAQLFHDRSNFTHRTDRLRFLRRYLQASGARGTLRGWQLMVEDAAARHTRRQHAQRDRRISADNRYFTRLTAPSGWRGHVVLRSKRKLAGSEAAELELTVDEWRAVLADPTALLTGEGVTVVKDSRSSLVVRRKITVGKREVTVFIKRARRKKPWKILADCFRPSRALRAFRLGHALLTRRIPVALPLAAMERRIGPFLVDNILITEAVSWPRLDEFLAMWLARTPTGHARLPASQQHQLGKQVLWQMGRLLQQLHDNNFAHRDLKASNMFVCWRLGHTPEIVLVDLDGLRRVRSITMRQRFQGLMRLNVSLLKCPVVDHHGRLRMLLGYLRRPGDGRINFKPYWRVLEEWSDRKLRQQIRSRRHAQRERRQQAGRILPS